MEINKKVLASAFAKVMTSWLQSAEVRVVNGNLMYFSCSHEDGADLSPLQDIGIEIPPYHEQKHWLRGWGEFAFFITQENAHAICLRIRKECRITDEMITNDLNLIEQ